MSNPAKTHAAAPLATNLLPDGTDLDKLAKAVARHETASCTVGNSALVHRNAFGIMVWDKQGRRSYKTFASCEESAEDFKRIWKAYYGRFPDRALATKYSGNDRSGDWLANVSTFYREM